MSVDEMRVDEISVYKMIVNDRSVDETILDKMSAHKITINEELN